jgi:hypothetical protein
MSDILQVVNANELVYKREHQQTVNSCINRSTFYMYDIDTLFVLDKPVPTRIRVHD